MRRFRDSYLPSQLHRTYVGPMPWTSSTFAQRPFAQRRSILEKYPRGVILKEKNKRTKRKFPTVELPEIVLHLDAENSPYVRPFDDTDAAEQQALWEDYPDNDEVLARTSKLVKDIVRDDNMMYHQTTKPNPVRSISDYDIFAVALVGGSAVSSSLENFRLQQRPGQRLRPITISSLVMNGIPERILAGDANKVIPFMLNRQQRARDKEARSKEARSQKNAVSFEAFKLSLGHMKHLSQIRKLCSARTSASEKIWTDQAAIDHMVQTMRSMPPQPLEDVLKFVNNFTIRQLSEDIGLNASMSLYGLEIASRLKLLAPIVQYLQICLSQGCIGSDGDSAEVLETVGRGMLVALEHGQGTARGTRPELFALLTGRSLDNSEPQPALLGLKRLQRQEDARVHLVYVRLLAELGALRLLWYAWREDLEAADVTTFIRCVEVLSIAKGDASVDYTTVTGDTEKDAYLDLWAINSLDAYHASVTRASYSSKFADSLSHSEVKRALKSADIHQAMARFGELIARSAVAMQSDMSNEFDAEAESDADTESEAETRSEADNGPGADTGPEADTRPEADTEANANTAAAANTQPE